MPSSKTKKTSSSSKIVLNVGGFKHETYISTLRNIPDSRLCNLGERHQSMNKASEYDANKNEYFFDRHPGVFAHILNYYRTGKLHCPNDVCGPVFEEELQYWGIDEEQVETCCWELYKQHREKQEKLKCFKLPGFDDTEESPLLTSQDSGLFEAEDVISWWSRVQPKIWKSLEEPHSSQLAKIIGIISFVMFSIYIIKFSLSTLKFFEDRSSHAFMALSIIHMVCLAWFTMDFALRVVFSPNKRAFLKSVPTWTDFMSLFPLYVFLFFPDSPSLQYLEMLVMLKAVRIFQLFKLSYVLQVLTNTLTASLRELAMLLIVMAFQTAVFSSILYFIERRQPDTDFHSVPSSMWWAIITMTTVGYGDVSPKTWMGKVVGSACAICGVLVIALPVSVVASNFSIFYTYAKARLNLPTKTRRVALSHALTSMQIPRTSRPAGYPSINHNSFSSMERRNTQRTLNASELSFNFASSQPASPAMSRKSLNSYSSLPQMDTPKSNTETKSPNALCPEFGATAFQYPSVEDQHELAPPVKRASSASEVTSRNNDSFEDFFLTVPEKGSKLQASNISLQITSTYPLYLRRGAVTPASMSLKSNSTNSSINHLLKNISNDGLNLRRPILFLSRHSLSMQNLKTLNHIDPSLACSCTSMKSEVHIHSADDSAALTPVVCDMLPYVLNNPTIKICTSTQSLAPPQPESPLSTGGPAIAIIPPPEEMGQRTNSLDTGLSSLSSRSRPNACGGHKHTEGSISGNKSDTIAGPVKTQYKLIYENHNKDNETDTGYDNALAKDAICDHRGSDRSVGYGSTGSDRGSRGTLNHGSNLSLVENPLNVLKIPSDTKRNTFNHISSDDSDIKYLRHSTTL